MKQQRLLAASPKPVTEELPGASSLTDQVADAVRAAVRSGDLTPGRLYSAYQMADLLGVSRSPVREALLRLAEAGMVALERNRGFRIAVPGAREIAEVFHLRLLLEVPAVERVAASPPPGLATPCTPSSRPCALRPTSTTRRAS